MRKCLLPLLPLLTITIATPALAETTTPSTPRTGTYLTTFSNPSPLTTPTEFDKRLFKPDLSSLDLPKEQFLIHVPDDYSPATPHGIVLLINYKDSTEAPPQWLPILAKHHLIYAMDTHFDHPAPVTAALSVDAVHNLKKLYNIDPTRVYVIGSTGTQITALTFPDVFTGGVFYNRVEFYRPLPDPESHGTFPSQLPRPTPANLALARTHPYVIAPTGSADPVTARYQSLVTKAFQQDGFKSIQTQTIPLDDFHYPNLATPWFESALAFFESHPSTTQPVPVTEDASTASPTATPTTPATGRRTPIQHPTSTLSDPQRLLALAKVYISNKAYAPAQERLESIIKNYPDDPAAYDAQALLNTLRTQQPTTKPADTKPDSGNRRPTR